MGSSVMAKRHVGLPVILYRKLFIRAGAVGCSRLPFPGICRITDDQLWDATYRLPIQRIGYLPYIGFIFRWILCG